VRALCGEAIAVRRIKGWDANWTPPADPLPLAVAAAARVARGRDSPPVVRLPASDASRWRARGVPAVCFGPQPLLASGVDDYVEEQDVVDCAAIYARAAIAWLNRQPG
jgi:succinyl-diaminopimelate desuccinylase